MKNEVMLSREEFEKLYPGPSDADLPLEERIKQASERHVREAEMQTKDRNVMVLTDKLSSASPVSGLAGLATMMGLAAMAPDRWLPYRKANPATVPKHKKERNRARNKNAAASRRKNRR